MVPEYVEHALLAIPIALLYAICTLSVGFCALHFLKVQASPYQESLAFGTGCGIYATVFTALSLAQLAYGPLLVIFLLVMALSSIGLLPRGFKFFSNSFTPGVCRPFFFLLGIICVLFYSAAFSLCPFRGADLANYHLLIPDRVLFNHGYQLNPFLVTQGTSLGWHHYGLAAFYMGQEAGYLGLSLMALFFLIYLIIRVIEALSIDFPDRAWLTGCGACLSAFTIAGMLRDSISNTDVPALFIEAILLISVIHMSQKPQKKLALLIGFLCGLALAIKLTTVITVLISLVIYLYANRKNLSSQLLLVALGGILLGPIWAIISILETGSPMPQVMNAFRLYGTALPHFADATQMLKDGHGIWYSLNFTKLFTGPMAFMPINLVLAFTALWLAPSESIRRVIQFFLLIAFLRYGLLFFASGCRPDILWNDRYHLASYVLISLCAAFCLWFIRLRILQNKRFSSWLLGGVTLYPALCLALFLFMPSKIQTLGEPGDSNFTTERLPPYLEILWGWNRLSYYQSWDLDPMLQAVQKTDPHAVIATNWVQSYHLRRNFLQLAPISQNQIDLRLPPEKILIELQKQGATHLYLHFTTGLNPGFYWETEKWMTSVRAIPHLPGVRLIAKKEVSPLAVKNLGLIRYGPFFDEFYELPQKTPPNANSETSFRPTTILH